MIDGRTLVMIGAVLSLAGGALCVWGSIHASSEQQELLARRSLARPTAGRSSCFTGIGSWGHISALFTVAAVISMM